MNRASLQLMKSVGIFSPLSDDEIRSLHARMTEKQCCRGEPLFREGDTGEEMYIVLSGAVSITVNTPDGKSLEIAEIPEGNFFGEMSIFDRAPRSATCFPKCDARLLSLNADDFHDFIRSRPEAGLRVMRGMLDITSRRLENTGAFLSDMVTWGEQARTRAITDECTGLYNRRFLDESLDELLEQADDAAPLSLVMADLDHFGTINGEYGQQTGDELLLSAVSVFRKAFTENHILARYGGDEFMFLLPGTPAAEARRLCERLIEELGTIDLLRERSGTIRKVSASIGIATCADRAVTPEHLIEAADKALYRAKEAGRGRAEEAMI